MKVVTAFAVVAALLASSAQAASIDSGFTLDGSTTYCMGIPSAGGAVGTLNFDSLEASNVGRCPVGVTLTLTGSEFHENDLITVKWAATANKEVGDGIFPNAIDKATGLPGAVTTSKLSACTAGTNCATNVGGTPTGADGTNSGAFGTDGTKALETNTFTLPTAGDYVIVGHVSLPGDSALSLAAEEYLVFKKISIVSADTVISSTSGSVGTASASGSSSDAWSTTAPPLTSASSTGSSASGSSASESSASSSNSTMSGSGSPVEQNSSSGSPKNEDTLTSTDSAKTPTTSDDTTDSTASGPTLSASTSSSSGGFLGTNGVIILAAVVGCCIVGVVGFAFVMRRRKEQHTNTNKAFDLNSPSMSSDMDDSGLHGHGGGSGKIDLTYVANISARNNDKNTVNMMSEESSVAIMASAVRGSEMNSSNGNSMHSLPRSSLDPDDYSDKVSYGQSEAEIDPYRSSNMSDRAGGAKSEASSMSNFGDSVVSARQNNYLKGHDSESSHMDSRLDSMEQAELKARGFGSMGGFSTVSGLSEEHTSRITGMSDRDSNRDIGFSMASRPTVESRFTEDYRPTEESTVDPRFSEEYRTTEDSRATGFSEALDSSRLQSEVSVDSYGFRASRSSVDSYSSGVSSYSREGSRISGFSVDSDRSSRY